jgi:peptide/nickel transport system permease protein
MLSKIKIWHLIFALSFLLIVLRFSLILNTYMLLYFYVRLLFSDLNAAINQFSLSLFDSFVSGILVLAIFLHFVFRKVKSPLLNRRLDFTSFAIVVLGMFFLFAPLISTTNPDFQKNIGVTKLLPPFSSVKVLHLKKEEKHADNILDDYINQKKLVIKNSFDENIIFADSVSVDSEVVCYQRDHVERIAKANVIFKNGKPFLTTKYFLLGSDELGRDIFSRLIYGARISLFVGLGSVFVSLILGMLLGFLAGYWSGFTGSLLGRITDMFLAFPVIFLIILILALFGNSLFTVIVVLGFSGWMSLFKIVRGEVVALKNKDYFISAQLAGLSKTRLLTREVLPVIIAPVIVNLVFQYGNVILAEAALSFLGLGTGNSYPSWGAMIESGQNYLSHAWWMIFFPGFMLFFTLYTANDLGKKINTYFNPRIAK